MRKCTQDCPVTCSHFYLQKMNQASIPHFISHQKSSIGWPDVSCQHFEDGGFPGPVHTKQTKTLDSGGEMMHMSLWYIQNVLEKGKQLKITWIPKIEFGCKFTSFQCKGQRERKNESPEVWTQLTVFGMRMWPCVCVCQCSDNSSKTQASGSKTHQLCVLAIPMQDIIFT